MNETTPQFINEDAVTLSELISLLELSAQSANRASQNLRFDFYNDQQRTCVGLLQTIIEYALAVLALVKNSLLYAPAVVTRSALDAYVDIANLCADPKYYSYLEAADASAMKKYLEAASAGINPYLAAIAESEILPRSRKIYSERANKLKSKGIAKLEIEERFKQAGLNNEYAAYSQLSAEAHNNISFINCRYFDLRIDPPILRNNNDITENRHNYDKACVVNMIEIVLKSTEKVLRLCNHGVAVLGNANEEYQQVIAKLVVARLIQTP